MPATYAEINLDRLAANARAIAARVAPARLIPVIKADAYGHGALPVARRLAQEGYDLFAVAQFREAMELRDSGFNRPLLVFGRVFPDEIPTAVRAGLHLSVFGKEDLRWLARWAGAAEVPVHVNVETGMGRVGVLLDQEADFFHELVSTSCCRWEGLYSHFATADERDKEYAEFQLARFQEIAAGVRRRGWRPRLLHLANSGAILDLPATYFDAVRPGILLYGHYPSSQTSKSVEVLPVMTFKTYVAHLRSLPAGHSVSYGRRWIAPRETRIAVLPVGYADGIDRRLTNCGEVLIRGNRCPIVGTVTMDQTMVAVGGDDVQPGDEVIVWGDSPQGRIDLLEVAERIGTIPYELCCGVSSRVPRRYVDSA